MAESAGLAPARSVIDRAQLARIADWAAIAVAVSLPWSTSATAILIVVWLIALVPTLDRQSAHRALAWPAGTLAVALWGLAVVGTLWADVAWGERLHALRVIHKLLMIPLLLIQFHRSDRGAWVLGGFLASCTALLIVSWVIWLWPSIAPGGLYRGVPVKDYFVQSWEFVLCAFALTHLAIDTWGQSRQRACALGLLAAAFLADVFFVASGRTALVIYAVLVLVIAFQRFGLRRAIGIVVAGAVLSVGAFAVSPYLHTRVLSVIEEVQQYRDKNVGTNAGVRLEFWKKAIEFIAEAPIIGHGTGSVGELFSRAAVGDPATASATQTVNVHNVTLQVAVQLGLVGVAVLYAMWVAHLLLFRGTGLVAWLGLGLVVQGIVGSLSFAYLFDFTSGWNYVFGVGVLGGMALRGDATNRPAGR